MEPLKPGTTFAAGRYEIVRTIGAGGMGAVYEVLHTETRRKRAMKVMLPSAFADKDLRERFQREAQVTADIESENIVEIFDAGVDAGSGSPFLVMELLKGEDLGAMLNRGERLTIAAAVDVFRQVARALDKTHAASIVHRDLKPDNLFLTRREDGSPRVKILDFGIAKLVSSTQGKSTKSIGTPLYMAPEQALGVSAQIGPRSDLYAFAHVIYTLLVGLPYFAPEAMLVENALALLLEIRKGIKEPATTRAAREGLRLPEAFDAWFEKATALEPAKRFATAGEMVEAVAEILDASPPAKIAPVVLTVSSPKAETGGSAYHATVAATSAQGQPKPFTPGSAGAANLRSQQVTLAEQSGSTVAVSASSSNTPASIGDAAKNTGALEPLSTGTALRSHGGGSAMRWALLAVPALGAVAVVAYFAMPSGREPVTGADSPTGVATATASQAQVGAAPSRPEVTAIGSPMTVETSAPAASSSPLASASAVASSASTKPKSVATVKKTAPPTATAPKTTSTVWTGGR